MTERQEEDPKWLRAWLGVIVLQSCGAIFLDCTGKLDKFHTTTHINKHRREFICAEGRNKDSYVSYSNELVRFHALVICMLAMNRALLVIDCTSKSLHKCHLMATVMYVGHQLLEILHFKTLTVSTPNISTASINVVTCIFCLSYLYNLEEDNCERRSGPRRIGPRLFAKHYMESDVLPQPAKAEFLHRKKTS